MTLRDRLFRLLLAGLCVPVCGCAIYNPVKVWRFSFDFNAERQLAFHATGYDHLPPKVVRMRLTRWAYNEGPSPVPSTMIIPDGSPVSPPASPDVPPLPPAAAPPVSPDLLEGSRPAEMLPAPPLPATGVTNPVGPSAGRSLDTQRISYAMPRSAAKPQSPAGAWLFAPR